MSCRCPSPTESKLKPETGEAQLTHPLDISLPGQRAVLKGVENGSTGAEGEGPSYFAMCYSKRSHLNYLELTCWICAPVNSLFCLGCLVSTFRLCEHMVSVESPEAERHHGVKGLEPLTQNFTPCLSHSLASDLVQANRPLWTKLSNPYHGRKNSCLTG